jgi:hypothetical protein
MKKLFNWIFYPNWKTIYTCSGSAMLGSTFGCFVTKVPVTIIVKVSSIRNQYKCYMTDGYLTENVDLTYLISQIPEAKPIIAKYNLKY